MACDQRTRLHNYKIVFENNTVSMEVCSRCHKRMFFRKGFNSQRPDNKVYTYEHKRDLLQRQDNLYYKEYPERMEVSQAKPKYISLDQSINVMR